MKYLYVLLNILVKITTIYFRFPHIMLCVMKSKKRSMKSTIVMSPNDPCD